MRELFQGVDLSCFYIPAYSDENNIVKHACEISNVWNIDVH